MKVLNECVDVVMERYFDGEFMDSGSARENLEDLVKMVVKRCAEAAAAVGGQTASNAVLSVVGLNDE